MKESKDQVLDELLVIEYQSGDKKAMTILFKRWNMKLIKQGYWYTNNLQAAQDIAQDSWMAIMRNIHKLKDTSKFKAWALTIGRRKAMDWFRSQKKERLNKEDLVFSQPPEEGSLSEKTFAINKALMILPPDHRSILTLYYFEELSVKTIAKIHEIPEGTVKSRLFQARNKLKHIFKKSIL